MRVNLTLNRVGFSLRADLHLPDRGFTVLFGPSGSGKTSLLRCIAGLERAQGSVSVAELDWQDDARKAWVPTWRRPLGYVFQEASLFPHLSVRENLSYGVKRAKSASARTALEEAIELLGIAALLDRDPASLSGGERQRVAIARALATNPRLLLLDEPLASLDMNRKEEVLPWLAQLQARLAIPVLYVTHSMQELTRLADHVVLLEAGEVPVSGPVQSVLSDPEFARRVGSEAGSVLMGEVAVHDRPYGLLGVSAGGLLLWSSGADLPIGAQVRVHIRASDVSLNPHEPQAGSIQNLCQASLIRVEADRHPSHCLVLAEASGQSILARITRRAADQLSLSPGQTVWLQVKSVSLVGT
ncbi:MAG: molybdenum transporter ATP-binding protein [Pseudomonadota bacterium]